MTGGELKKGRGMARKEPRRRKQEVRELTIVNREGNEDVRRGPRRRRNHG
jgi:hypothetical protein